MFVRTIYNLLLTLSLLSQVHTHLPCWINYDTQSAVTGITFEVPVQSSGPLYGAEVCMHYLYDRDQHFFGGGSREFAKYIVDNPNYRNLFVCDTDYCNNNTLVLTTRTEKIGADAGNIYMITGLVSSSAFVAIVGSVSALIWRWKRLAKVVPELPLTK